MHCFVCGEVLDHAVETLRQVSLSQGYRSYYIFCDEDRHVLVPLPPIVGRRGIRAPTSRVAPAGAPQEPLDWNHNER